MVSLWYVLALLTFLSLEASGTYPGVKVRVTQKGLEYECQISIIPLQEKLKTIKIPDQHGKEVSLIDISYWVTGIQVQQVSLPMAVGLVPGTGVRLSISEGYIGLQGNWRVSYLWVDDNGWFDMVIRGLRISVTISTRNDGTGRPMVSTTNCGASIDEVKVWLYGGWSSSRGPLNIRSKEVKKQVKEAINRLKKRKQTYQKNFEWPNHQSATFLKRRNANE